MLAMFIMGVGGLLAHAAAKWAMVGRYKEGSYSFFGEYHAKWMVMMLLAEAAEDLVKALQGSELLAMYWRLMGAKIGTDCCLFGLALEYDLLALGDGVAIGWDCDTTCHTVENMVIKLAPTIAEDGAAVLPHSMLMPGCVLGAGATLLENSQVLKGEHVPAREVWAGLPAMGCRIELGLADSGIARQLSGKIDEVTLPTLPLQYACFVLSLGGWVGGWVEGGSGGVGLHNNTHRT